MGAKPIDPRVRPQLSPGIIEAFRRERIVRGTAESAHAHGARHLKVSDIVRHSKMARSTFYSLFATKREALEFSCQEATDFLLRAVRGAGRNGQRPPREVVIDRFIEAAEEEPLLAELCLLHSLTAPMPEPDRYLSALIQALNEELGETRFSELTAVTIVQAVRLQLTRGSASDLSAVRDDLIRLTARPDEV